MITPDNKDFFYICTGHLVDRGFCQPDAGEAAATAALKKKEEFDREIEAVKKEYEEKQKIKKEKRKEKGKDKEKEKEETKTEEQQDKDDEKVKDDKIKELSQSKDQAQVDLGPRIFTLNKNFHQMRIDRIRNIEQAKRNRERLSNPANFPAPPSGNP
ncbi:hypothetical protein P280DRAFT_474019 [Massarina eburnea CBS 473.64]|uniref:DUF1742-domain-containing protein n=1 Tax=Massarina eburnea CBS 473.64 TaxID=1395130 RepID=A0A6A6RM11_9PLEO|nr:hypothetical protein P280DRAFT_474019 [Massarina eburnea CBS 473.64]